MTDAYPTIALRVRNDLSELERVSRDIEDLGRAGRAAAEDISAVLLAVDEVLTNVISYAFPSGEEHWVHVRAGVEQGILTVEIEDDGKQFDPVAVAEPQLEGALEERTVGGLGIHIARRLVDEMTYRRHAGHNILTLTKRLTQHVTAEVPQPFEVFRFDESEDDGAVVFTLRGRLDARGSQLLEDRLRAKLEAGRSRFVFECERLAVVGSAGLRVLLIAAKESAVAGGGVALVALPDEIARTLEIAGLSTLLPRWATCTEALAALR